MRFVTGDLKMVLSQVSWDGESIRELASAKEFGNIAGRWNHARKSAALSAVFLDGLENLLPIDKDTIVKAIDDHSDGENISSAVGASLLIADKVDISKRRCLPVETIDDWHKNLLQIEDVDISVSDGTIAINFITTEAFSKEEFVGGYKKGFGLMTKAAKYLGCTCHYQFNGMEESSTNMHFPS